MTPSGRPRAIGFLRTDIAGPHQKWLETTIRSLAKRLGYDLCKTIALSAQTADPISLLLDQVERTHAEAIIVPGRVHLDGHIKRVVQRVDVIFDVDDVEARWPLTDVIGKCHP
ncbi:hypothetical protein OHA40_21135 [Nocardia sp. NBC_00508]|uniref:hypothetical protein n=1 Tax=Nocardia sp. NBC_00508 TaxID=2975992 RepID=UPI002E809892|nr:hypothetical protein [Nocardia sp. NBC_00508]WUD64209.1 hypothetical protein OHA40_21135 [Nocardia sp. NBC_00508]